MNANELLTKADLENFRKQLLQDIAAILAEAGDDTQKKWLRSREVRQLLSISNGTLATLRVQGKLNPTKVSGIHYYKLSEIQALLNGESHT